VQVRNHVFLTLSALAPRAEIAASREAFSFSPVAGRYLDTGPRLASPSLPYTLALLRAGSIEVSQKRSRPSLDTSHGAKLRPRYVFPFGPLHPVYGSPSAAKRRRTSTHLLGGVQGASPPRLALGADGVREGVVTCATEYWTSILQPSSQRDRIVDALLAQRALSTRTSYAHKVRRFIDFCSTQPDAPIALPSSVESVMRWMVSLTFTDVAASSLQPYLSALNSWHRDLDLEPPALGPAIASLKKGLENLQAEEGFKTDVSLIRAPLPSAVVGEWLDYALRMDPATHPHLFRALVTMVVQFSWCGRSEANFLLRDSCVRIDDFGVSITSMMSKGKHNKAEPAKIVPRGAILGYQELLTKWVAFRGSSPLFFLFPSESIPSANPSGTWLALAFTVGNFQPPPGKTWLTHSLRSGGASAAFAVGVVELTLNWWGGWVPGSQVPAKCYIDPSTPACMAARRFFSWLAK
jgi:hypothetical protein